MDFLVFVELFVSYILGYSPLGGTKGLSNGGYVLMSSCVGVLILMNSNSIDLLTDPSTDFTKLSPWLSVRNDR